MGQSLINLVLWNNSNHVIHISLPKLNDNGGIFKDSFFNALHGHFSKYNGNWRTHWSSMDLFINLVIPLETVCFHTDVQKVHNAFRIKTSSFF